MASSALVAHYRSELARIFGGRRVIVVGGPVAGLVPLARELMELGAERALLIGSSPGMGALPSEGEIEWISLGLSAVSVNESLAGYERRLVHPPESVRARVDAFDPERTAIALGAIVLGEVPTVCGRPRYGARPRDWMALEDKTRIDEIWDEAGLARAPSLVVAAKKDDMDAAARALDQGEGTVWVADARDGVHGGAEKLYWVRGAADAEVATRRLIENCDRVRIMPFLEGVPCSIHGLVCPEGTAVFRPVEIVTLRRRGTPLFVYAGACTNWDPAPADREAMREAAQAVGRVLAARVGFRGAFTLDGVMTRDGFRPTELNPRLGAGFFLLGKGLPGLPLALLSIAAQAGESLDYRPAALEAAVVNAADATRAGGGWIAVREPIAETIERHATLDGDTLRGARPGEVVAAKLMAGPSDMGGFLRLTPEAPLAPRGASVAPAVIRGFSWAEHELGVAIGALDPCSVVR